MSTLIQVIGRLFFVFIAALSLVACTHKADVKEVNLAIWGNYLPQDLVEKFTAQTGIKVNISNYTSNEELLAKIQAGSSGIDVAVPSDYMVSIMRKLDLLEPLDSSKIPNKSLVAADLLNQDFDPKNEYSLPYAWSTAGIAVNRDLYKGTVKSWKDVFTDPKLKGKLSLLDDVREVIGMALKINGKSVNSTNAEDLTAAKAELLKIKPSVKMFTSDTVEALVNKEVAVAQSYSTDALQAAAKTNGKIEYILPEEGGTRAIDTLVIVKGAEHGDNAHALINFMLSPEVNVAFVKNVRGGPVLTTTKEKLPEDLKTNASLFPTPEKLKKFEGIEDLGEQTQAFDEIWTQVKTE